MSSRKSESVTYVSVDIEADGRVPGLSSMLSFGAAAFTERSQFFAGFTRNLETLPEAKPENDTMEFWAKNPDAWNEARKNLVNPERAIQDFVEWVDSIRTGTRAVFIGYPASYDFKWIDYYCVRFAGRNPFGFSGCIDIKTLAWSVLGGNFSHVSKKKFPAEWKSKAVHSHIAIDDAIEQGELFFRILATRDKTYANSGVVQSGVVQKACSGPAESRETKTPSSGP